ncbi:MAG: 50S ribosomal protein L18 [Candidatus Omnitrophica bacterium]|nr:50S ribosomal protein L18 [Candidatus Omnitrophota bacterium]
MNNKKELLRTKRHRRIRMRMQGSPEKPRLCVRRSLKNMQAQIIDDTQNKVLLSGSTSDKQMKQKLSSAGNVKASEVFGEVFAKKALDKGIGEIVFDRAGYLYHGRIKAFADALRKGGLKF